MVNKQSIIVNANASEDFSHYLINLESFSFNFGNNICAEGLKRIYPEAGILNIPGKEDCKSVDSLILSLQDHLRPGVWKFIEPWIYELPTGQVLIPFVGANSLPGHPIGVNHLPDRAKSFLKEVSEHSVIGCRGLNTEAFLRSLGIHNTRIVGCASIHLGQIADEERSANGRLLTGGGLGPSGPNVDYWCQGDFDAALVKYLSGAPLLRREQHDGFMVFSHRVKSISFELNQRWTVGRIIVPYRVTDELRAYVARYTGYVGGRVHGAIFSALQGVPSVCLANDLRAYDLCGTLGIPIGSAVEFINDAGRWLDYFEQNAGYLRSKWMECSTRAREVFFDF